MIIVQIGFFIEDWHNSYLYPRLQDFIRTNLLKHLLHRYEKSYKEVQTGDVISSLLKAPLTMTYAYEMIKNTLLPFTLTLLIAVIYFFFIDKTLAVGLFILGATFLGVLFLAPQGCDKVTLLCDMSFNAIYEQVDDILRNLFSIYGSDTKEEELARLGKYEDDHQRLFQKTMTCMFKYKVIVVPITISYLVFFITRSYQLILQKKIGSRQFIPIFMIMVYILNFMIYTNDQFRDMIFEWGIVRAAEVMINNESKSQPQHDDTRAPVIPLTGIGLSHINFRYSESKQDVLHDYSLHIEPGEKVVIMGDIGSGKSTILKLLLRYHEPSSGVVYMNGQSYQNIDIKELRRRIGYVPQVPILFNRSVYENISYGVKIDRESIIAFLETHDIMKEFDNLKNGIDTVVGKNGSILSGGQRQLVWCLRILMADPDVLILDEPTSSIDTHMKQVLDNILQIIMKNKTVIMVTHDDFLLAKASRVITMKAGMITSDRRN
jgi:ABC-type multidrug transport system fused ATPase/permease subunit